MEVHPFVDNVGSDKGSAVQNQLHGLFAGDLAGEGGLQFRQTADGAEQGMQIVQTVIGHGIEGFQIIEEEFGEPAQGGLAFLKTMGRLTHGTGQAEDPVDLGEADVLAEDGPEILVQNFQTGIDHLFGIAQGHMAVLMVEEVMEGAIIKRRTML